MNPSIKNVLIGVAIVAAAVVLNPSAERHRDHIKEATAERSPLAGMIGLGSLAAMASNYHSIGVASYTSVRDKTVTVGAFGMVFLLDNYKDQ
ncbi:MAG: hypothetical protein ACK4FF_15350 [Limnobacter sp.]|uniref:hypothetical protein n=1 Tax=Limnobacter sp. TaxID=2003368 RepID=UPI00391B2F85